MSESPNTPMYVGDGPQESFIQTWRKALTKPREETYAELAVSPGASPSKAYLWVFLAGLVSFFLVLLIQSLVLGTGQGNDLGASVGSLAVAVLCGAPIGAGVSVLGFMLSTAIVQWIAGLFGGQGNYRQLAYVLGAIVAPVTIASGVLGALSSIPFVAICTGILSVGISIYAIVLEITAVKGVNRFGWGPAIGSVLLPGVVVALLCACFVGILFVAMGPAIGEIFSQINQSLIVP